MALDLGELVGYVKLDDKGFDDVLGKLPGKMNGYAPIMAAAGAALAVGVGMAISKGIADGMEMETAVAKVSAGLALTADESERVGKLAGQLYRDAYGESIGDVTRVIGEVISSIEGMRGANETALGDMAKKVMDFNTVFEVDTARTTQIVGQLIKSGLVKDAEQGMDLLTAVMAKVPANVREDVLDALDEYAPFMTAIGIQGEAAFTLLADAASKGMYGIDKTGDALKEFGIRATDMSTLSKSAFDLIGLSQQDMANQLLAGGDTARLAFDKILGGLQGIEDPAARANAAIALFGTPIEDLGVNEIPQFLSSLQNLDGGLGDTAGAAENMGKTVNDTAGVAFEELQRSYEGLIGTVGQFLLPILRELTDFFNANPAVLGVVIGVLGFLALAFMGVTVATWAMNTALLANPITWIVIGIVAAIAALVAIIVILAQNWDAVMKWIGDVWNGFVGWLTDGLNAFFGWWNGIWESVGKTISDIWNNIVTWIQDAWNAVSSWVINAIVAYVMFWFNIWRSVGEFVASVWNGFIGMIQDAWNTVAGWVKSAMTTFVNGWQEIWGKVGKAVSDMWNNMVSFFRDLPGNIVKFFSGVGTWLFDAGKNLIQGLFDGISSLASNIGKFFLDILPDWIVAPFKAALGIHSPSRVFADMGRNTVQGYLNGIEKMQPKLENTLSDLVDTNALNVTANASKAASNMSTKNTTVNYYATESASLSAEEQLFAALNSPRVRSYA